MLPLIFAGVTAVASITGTYLYTRNHYETVLAERTAAHATELADANAKALAQTIALQKAADEARRLAAIRQSALARDLAANRDALGRLSNATDGALRAASDSHTACVATAVAQGDVLKQCSSRLVEVAGAADGHVSDIKTLTASWPKDQQ